MATIDWLADRIGTRVMLYRILPETSDNMSSLVRIVMLVEVFFCFWSSNWKSRIRILFQLCFFSCKTSRWETSAKPAEPSVAFRKCPQLLHSKAGIVKIFFVDALPVVPAAEPMFSSAKPVAAPRPPTPCREEGACVGSSQVCWPPVQASLCYRASYSQNKGELKQRCCSEDNTPSCLLWIILLTSERFVTILTKNFTNWTNVSFNVPYFLAETMFALLRGVRRIKPLFSFS